MTDRVRISITKLFAPCSSKWRMWSTTSPPKNQGRCWTLDAGKVLVQSKDGYKVGEYLHYESVCAMPVTIENCLSREISVKISKPQVPSEWKAIPPLSSITIAEGEEQ